MLAVVLSVDFDPFADAEMLDRYVHDFSNIPAHKIRLLIISTVITSPAFLNMNVSKVPTAIAIANMIKTIFVMCLIAIPLLTL